MSHFSTGEMARLCGVTVRTVQYYDSRGILCPSALSEGGRRLYSEDDLRRLKIICFLRELGLPLDAIGQLLTEEDPGSVISLLLDEQEKTLRGELSERQAQLDKLAALRQELGRIGHFSVESIGDIAFTMKSKTKLERLRRTLILTGIPLSLLQWGGIALWIVKGVWKLFALWAVLALPYGLVASRCYFRNVAYLCPQCHEVFRPRFRDALFARHTPRTRRLTCTCCGHHGFCVEVWGGEET